MAERNYGEEIDALRKEIGEIKEMLQGKAAKDNFKEDSRFVEKVTDMTLDAITAFLMERIQNECEADGSTGRVVYTGVFASGGRQSNWISRHNTDNLLKFIENRSAERVLACIGSKDKLNILLALLRKPMTVAEIVNGGGFNSTGHVYHHLNALVAADLVKEDSENNSRGVYIVTPHRVQGIIMLLSGIADMLDETYSIPNF